MSDIPILELRRIEANIIKPIYEEMAREIGHEKADEILGAAIEKAAIEQGKSRLYFMLFQCFPNGQIFYCCVATVWIRKPLNPTYSFSKIDIDRFP